LSPSDPLPRHDALPISVPSRFARAGRSARPAPNWPYPGAGDAPARARAPRSGLPRTGAPRRDPCAASPATRSPAARAACAGRTCHSSCRRGAARVLLWLAGMSTRGSGRWGSPGKRSAPGKSRGQWRAENGRRPRMRPLALSGLRATKRRALAADGHGNGTGRRASMAPARSPGKRSAPGAARPESAPGLAPAGETESLEAAAPRMRPSALSGLRALSVLFRNRQGTADDGTRAVAHQSITVHLQHGRVAGRYPHPTFALQPPVLAGRLQPGDEGPDARARVRQPRHGHEYAVALLILEAGRAEHEADRLPILRLQCESVRIFHGENLRKPGQQQQH